MNQTMQPVNQRNQGAVVQATFRALLTAMSRPGTIVSLTDFHALHYGFSLLPGSQLLLMTLLDAEVTFGVESDDSRLVDQLARLTYSQPLDCNAADYVLVGLHQYDRLFQIITNAKRGTLSNPHLGATIIIEVESLSNDDDLILRGPGIQTQEYLGVVSTFPSSSTWIQARQIANQEFPLGVDLIFVDQQHQIAALPRTTITSTKEEMTWHMSQ